MQSSFPFQVHKIPLFDLGAVRSLFFTGGLLVGEIGRRTMGSLETLLKQRDFAD